MACRRTSAAAEFAVDVEQDVFSLQVIRQRATSRWRFGFRSESRLRFLGAADAAVKVLKTERKLVGIDALGAASELHSLQLFDDGLEPLDLGVAMVDRSTKGSDSDAGMQ